MKQISEGEKAGTYYLDVARGGPSLELTLPACYAEGDRLVLGPGMLSHQEIYLNPDSG